MTENQTYINTPFKDKRVVYKKLDPNLGKGFYSTAGQPLNWAKNFVLELERHDI